MEETVLNKQCIELWPEGTMPGVRPAGPEHVHNPGQDSTIRITGIHDPAMYYFPAPGVDGPAPVMVVCPGGGYAYMAWNKEGTAIAQYLNGHGIAAMVLKYRCPDNRDGAFADVQRALRLIRAHAAEWGVDANRVGVMGFSAGGHLSARAAVGSNHSAYAPVDEIDRCSAVPDIAVLVYPAYLNDEASAEPDKIVAPELLPFGQLPPVLVLHNEDDSRYVRGSKAFSAAMSAAGYDIEKHIWQTGGHGYGLDSQAEVKAWPEEMLRWFRKKGFLR